MKKNYICDYTTFINENYHITESKAFDYLFTSEPDELLSYAEKCKMKFGNAGFGRAIEIVSRYLLNDRSDEVFVGLFASLLHKIKDISNIKNYGFDDLARRGNLLDLNLLKSNFDLSNLDNEGKYLLKILEEFGKTTANISKGRLNVIYIGMLMTGLDVLPIEEDEEMQEIISDLRQNMNDYFKKNKKE